MMARHGRGCSVIATQLPTEITRREIEDNFSVVGTVTKCHLVRDKDGVFKGVAYVVYTDIKDAKEAVEKLNNTQLNDKIIKVKLTHQKENDNSGDRAVKSGDNDGSQSEGRARSKKRKDAERNQRNKKNRKGRIVIRNLSFQVDEKVIEDHFSQFGKVSEVSILRKKDGKMVGCAFVQFSNRNEALKAIKECNMKPLLGRPIAVDLAVPKEKFATVTVKQEPVKEEPMPDEPMSVKEEHVAYVKDENESFENDEMKEENAGSEDDSDDSGLEKDGESDNDDYDDEDEEAKETIKKPFTTGPSKDVAEERTIFIKNLSYQATEEEIREILEKYGSVKYVLLCIDQLTQHPRGTAFAQFMEREAADECLKAESDPSTKHLFTLHTRPMHIMRAISRKELQERSSDKQAVPKDKRNMYLAREGFVREGTLAAAGVSKADMMLRIKREQVKRRMLKNLHIFVSPIRLCINNLPKTLTDKDLRRIFKTHAPNDATISETRIMKNLKSLDENGKPTSRGYGFVSFTKHEHALAALRTVNNNPEIFTSNQRPIVEFALENRSVLKAREKRTEKSKEKNPLWKSKNLSPSTVKDSVDIGNQTKDDEATGNDTFMGSKSSPTNRDLPANYGPKIRHNRTTGKITRKQLKKDLKNRLQGKKRKRPINSEAEVDAEAGKMQNETTGEPKKKKKKKITKRMKAEMKSDKSFNMMVQDYKKKMKSVEVSSGKRWFED